MLTRNKVLSHAILILLLVSAFPLTVHISSENASAISADNTWISDSASYSGISTNWENGTLETGQNIWFVDAHDGSCTWNNSLGATSFGAFLIRTGYSGTITQGAHFSVTSYSQTGGTFTGSGSYMLTDSGDFTQTGGTISVNLLKLTMSGSGKTINQVGTNLYSLTINGDTTITSLPSLRSSLTIASGKTLTLGAGVDLLLPTWVSFGFSNAGTMNGPGIFEFIFHNVDQTITFGTINCPLVVYTQPGATGNRIVTAGTNTILGSSLTVKSTDATYTLTLDLSTSNYSLSATTITIGTRGILNGRTSTIMCSGDWDSSAGTFIRGYSSVYMTGVGKTLKTGTAGFWNLVFPYGSSTTLQSHVWAEAIGFSGALTQSGKLINVTGSYEYALTATGSWTGDIYLNGTGTQYTIPIIVPFTPTGRIFSKVKTTYVNGTSGQLTVIPPIGIYGGIRLSRINMNYFEAANWSYNLSSGTAQFELTLKSHYTYQLYANGLAYYPPINTGVDGIAYWTYSSWSTVTFNVTGSEITPTETTTILTFILALSFGFGLLAFGLRDRTFWILAGPIWMICGLTIFIDYGLVFLLVSAGLGIVLMFKGVSPYL